MRFPEGSNSETHGRLHGAGGREKEQLVFNGDTVSASEDEKNSGMDGGDVQQCDCT